MSFLLSVQKVAPRGWTKEINPITSTPIYTNSRTGERWGLASDGRGNYYYYNMANSSLTVGELPEIVDVSGQGGEGGREEELGMQGVKMERLGGGGVKGRDVLVRGQNREL